MNIKSIFWALPFLSFLGGYLLISFLFSPAYIKTPSLMGKPLVDAIRILSDHQLNTRIIMQKEDTDLPEGTILSQQPNAHQKVRPHTSIFLIISRKPSLLIAPNLSNKSENEIKKYVRDKKIRAKYFHLPSLMPSETCIGHFPQANKQLIEKRITIYISRIEHEWTLMPLLRNMELHEAQSFLCDHHIKPIVIHKNSISHNHRCTNCIVIDQKPIGGSLVDHNNLQTVYLYVREK